MHEIIVKLIFRHWNFSPHARIYFAPFHYSIVIFSSNEFKLRNKSYHFLMRLFVFHRVSNNSKKSCLTFLAPEHSVACTFPTHDSAQLEMAITLLRKKIKSFWTPKNEPESSHYQTQHGSRALSRPQKKL